MSIFGVDVGRDQTPDAMDGAAFAILNVEDPGCLDKVRHVLELSIPWGLYSWVYPGRGSQTATRVVAYRDLLRAIGLPDPPLGYWWDYEQDGVEPGDLEQAFAAADAAGISSGYYSGPRRLDHGAFLARPWWNSAYPNANDGSFPGVESLWDSSKPRPMQLWQFTSGANGPVHLDRNLVMDEEWYAATLRRDHLAGDEDMAYTATGPDGRNWLIDGVERHEITWDTANALASAAAPVHVEYVGHLDDVVLGAFAEVGSWAAVSVNDADVNHIAHRVAELLGNKLSA